MILKSSTYLKNKNKTKYYITRTNFLILFFCTLILSGCKVQKLKKENADYVSIVQNSSLFKEHFMGFMLFDPETSEVKYAVNEDKYFTPASNTKLFTFYTCLKILGDSIPSIKYSVKGDSLFFSGTGDPSFLHPEFTSQETFHFLNKRTEKLYYIDEPFHDEAFGLGWSWDDYHYTFSAEKAMFPIYGNFIRFIYKPFTKYPEVIPPYFNRFTKILDVENLQIRDINRSFTENLFSFQIRTDTVGDTVKIPFKYSNHLFVELLKDTLNREVNLLHKPNLPLHNIFYGSSSDSLYKEMLTESDNFIAEQLMLVCALSISDTITVAKAIEYAQKNFLYDLNDKVKWVDGSGLSRYNLFTPQSMVNVLDRIYKMIPEQRLFSLMPAGGVSGTLKNWYRAEKPYVFAKTGSLSNVHSLSGYIKAKSGKVLIFSFMHNNYLTTTKSIRLEMEKVLKQIYLEH